VEIDLILEDAPTSDFEAMISAVLRAPIKEAIDWKPGFMVPTKFSTGDYNLRVFIMASLRTFRIPFLTKAHKRARAASTNVIETTDIEGSHRFLSDGRVTEVSGILESDRGIDCFTFSVESGPTFEVRNSNINLPYLEAMHLGFC